LLVSPREECHWRLVIDSSDISDDEQNLALQQEQQNLELARQLQESEGYDYYSTRRICLLRQMYFVTWYMVLSCLIPYVLSSYQERADTNLNV
jgi:hypothetical protein